MELTAAPKCPKCGAAAPEAKAGAAYTCPFCSEVSTVATLPPRPVILAQEIISRVVMVDAAGRESLQCPRCAVGLFEGRAGDTTLHGCGQCGGVWLDNVGSQRVVNVGPSDLVALAERASKSRHGTIDEAKPVNCPFDGAELKRTTVRGLEVDVCPTHGTWFDAGEVRRIANVYNAERQASAGGATYDYELAAKETSGGVKVAAVALDILSALFLEPPGRR